MTRLIASLVFALSLLACGAPSLDPSDPYGPGVCVDLTSPGDTSTSVIWRPCDRADSGPDACVIRYLEFRERHELEDVVTCTECYAGLGLSAGELRQACGDAIAAEIGADGSDPADPEC